MRARIVFGYHVFSGICVDLPGLKTSGLPRAIGVRARFVFGCFGIFVSLPGLKTSGLPRAIGVRARLPPMKSKSAMHKAASRWLNTLCISLGKK